MGTPALARLRPLLLVLAGGVAFSLGTCVVHRAADDAAKPEPRAGSAPAPALAASAPVIAPAPAASLEATPPPAPSFDFQRPVLPSSKSMLPMRVEQLLPAASAPAANAPPEPAR